MNRTRSPAGVNATVSRLSKPEFSNWAIAFSYVLLYVAIDRIAAVRPVLAIGITPWHPAMGITLAFLLLQGNRWIPFTFVATLLSGAFSLTSPTGLDTLLAASLWVTMVYGVLASVMRRWGLSSLIDTSADAARFVALAAAAAMLAAVGRIGINVISGAIDPTEALYGFARYGFADLNGILMVTPLVIHWFERRKTSRAFDLRLNPVLAQGLALLVTLVVLFSLPAAYQLRFFYMLFLPIIWIALRSGLSGAIAGALAIQIGLVVAVKAGIQIPLFIDLQLLMLTLTLTALLLGAVVTERRRAVEQLRERDAALARAMRFAVAGELAGALAHELNQPITALVSYLRASEILIERGASEGDRLKDTLGKAVREILRASDVLRRLRDFYRGNVCKREVIELPALCETLAKAFQERLRSSMVSLEVVMEQPVPAVTCDATQLAIVLHNLLANAIDAVTAVNGDVRRVELRVVRTEQAVLFCIDDSGAGVAAEIAPRLFEPFVTSKNDGMGLGLAISRSLVRAGGGELTHAPSKRLGGSCFTIRIPLDHRP